MTALPPLLGFTLAAGGLVALLDGLVATGFWAIARGVPPSQIFQGIAAGLLGREAFAGGWATVALGALLHLGMACMMAAAFGLAALHGPALLRQPLWAGLAYGALVYAVMHVAVLPLSRAMPPPTWVVWRLADVASHLLLVGLPIAWLASRWLAARTT